jgi:murein DD-endopeptidase MepM/ murein hydrolase activator NlpD
MMERRAFLAATAGLIACPNIAMSRQPRFSFKGDTRQGALIVGQAEPGAAVTLDGKVLRLSPEGIFVFGFSYDQKKPSLLAIRYADGMAESREITPSVRAYEIQRISGLPENDVSPPPEILERIKRESAIIRRVRLRDTAASWFAERFDWPAPGIMSSIFGSQRILNGVAKAPHLAVDIAAPTGTPIHAPAPGIVALCDEYYLDGGFTILDHGQGISTCYVHQNKRFVAAGDQIARGQVIGEIGRTGRATGPNLHWGLNWFQIALDPSLSTPTPIPPKG